MNVKECEYCDYHVMTELKKVERQTAPKAPANGQKNLISGAHAAASAAPRRATAAAPQSQQDKIAAAAKLLMNAGFTLTAPDPNSSRHDFGGHGGRQPLGGVAPTSAPSSRPQLGQIATPRPPSTCGPILPRDGRSTLGGAPGLLGLASSSTVQLASKSRPVVSQRQALAAPAPRNPLGSALGSHSAGARSSGRSETKSAFESNFGKVDVSSAEASRVLGARPIHEASAREEEMDRVDKSLKVLAKKDELNEKVRCKSAAPFYQPAPPLIRTPASPLPRSRVAKKLPSRGWLRCRTSAARIDSRRTLRSVRRARPCQVQQITSRDVTATKCETCGYLAMKARDECVQQCHIMKKIPTKQRWFECRKCRNHITLLNQRLPEAACEKCHDTSWQKAGMRRSSGSSDPSRGFQARGVEHGKFLSSDGPRPRSGGDG